MWSYSVGISARFLDILPEELCLLPQSIWEFRNSAFRWARIDFSPNQHLYSSHGLIQLCVRYSAGIGITQLRIARNIVQGFN
jgi:hypothetical protein